MSQGQPQHQPLIDLPFAKLNPSLPAAPKELTATQTEPADHPQLISSKRQEAQAAKKQPRLVTSEVTIETQQRQGNNNSFPVRKPQQSKNGASTTIASQQLSDMTMKKHAQFSVNSSGMPVTPILHTVSSNTNMISSAILQREGKRSTLEEAGGSQLHQEGKFRLQQASAFQPQAQTMMSSVIYPPPQQDGFSRGFKGTGNQIAAVGSPPFVGKSNNSTLGQQNTLLGPQQPPQWISRMTRGNNPNQTMMGANAEADIQAKRTFEMMSAAQQHGDPNLQMQQMAGSAIRIGSNANIHATTGRKARVKSNRKRRFSSSSITQKTTTPGHASTNTTAAHQHFKLQGHSTDPVAQAAAQIMKGKGETIVSQQIASMSAAYSSVAELNLNQQESVPERFNSRSNKIGQLSTHNTGEKLYQHMHGLIDPKVAEKMARGAHYGGVQNQLSQAPVSNMKKYSQSVTRRNHAALQETASGHGLERTDSQDHASQQSNKNFNSLRNSRSLNKKLSTTAQKKTKKLKKSESQVRHQQVNKQSDMLGQPGHLPEEPDRYQLHQNQPTPSQNNTVKRSQNRTPQSFLVQDKIVGSATQHRQASKQSDLIKGSTAGSLQNGQIGNNLIDLTKNTMHIKKLNFTGRSMQSHATQPVIANQAVAAGQQQQFAQRTTNSGLEPLQQLQMVLQNQAKQQYSIGKDTSVTTQKNANTDRQAFFQGQQAIGAGSNSYNTQAASTIDSLLRQHATHATPVFNDFKQQFSSTNSGAANQAAASTASTKPYKLMKSAERGEINTHNLVMCSQHKDKANGVINTKSPCTCVAGRQPNQGGFQSKASQNFQKTFRQGNFVYHGSRRSSDFSTIQTKQSQQVPSGQSPFAGSNPQQVFNAIQAQTHMTQAKREDINKFGGNFQTPADKMNPSLNPLMNDLLQYLQQAYQNQQESIGAAPLGATQPPAPFTSDQIKQRLMKNMPPVPPQQQQPQPQQLQQPQPHQSAAESSAAADSFTQSQRNKLIHFEKGDRIIYEPNEMHQLKYINDKGEVSPITGVQYILTQPNFSKGRPCHFFVVNKQEFEAATQGFKKKQEEAKAEELAKQKKLQAVANIRSHRASQKLRPQGTLKSKQKERKQSAKGGRNDTAAKEAKAKEEEKKDEKDKYYNEIYTYQKLRSLKWMGGPYKNPDDQPAPIWRPSAEEQEIRQQLEAKREIKAKYNLLSLAKQDQTELYKYILLLGNNQDVVKRVMDSRQSWVAIKSSQTLYNFKWAPSSRQIKFDFLSKHGQKNLVNHFENHQLITTKDQLIDSLSKLCENLHQDCFNSIPITFVVDLGTPLCQHEFDKFCYYFNMLEKGKDAFLEAQDEDSRQEALSQINRNIEKHHALSEKKRKYTTFTMKDTLFNGHNMWLFKPADANRGRGVNLFNTIDQLKRLIVDHTSRAETKQFQNFAHANGLNTAGTAAALVPEEGAMDATAAAQQPPVINTANIKSDVFVLQKYIEKPLLISQRKFDIRLWVIVTPEHKCYYFKEGYLRMSGQAYDLNQVDNLLVHLTNNAIQKHSQNYGQFEEGNILSFDEGKELLKKQDNLDVDFHELLREEILPIIELTMTSVRQKINKNSRKFCMEIFGYDFMVDSSLKPWLIEVNTNPCLEESNKLLRDLIPRMLDDAFKLTLDVMFPPLAPAKLMEAMGEEYDPNSKGKVFPVKGYTDEENMWGDQPFYILRVPGCVVVQGS